MGVRLELAMKSEAIIFPKRSMSSTVPEISLFLSTALPLPGFNRAASLTNDWRNTMKRSLFAALLMSAAALGSTLIAAPTFAATADQPAPQAQVQQKTRAEVRQELVAAEKSGELARLDTTVYDHS